MMQSTEEAMRDKPKGIDIDLIQIGSDFIKEILGRAHVYLAVICVCTAAIMGKGAIGFQSQYSAKAVLSVNASIGNYNTKYQKNNATYKLGLLYPSILMSEAVEDLVKEDLGYSDELPAQIDAMNVNNTNMITLSVRAADPQLAYDVLQSVLRVQTEISEMAVGSVAVKVLNDYGVPEVPDNKRFSAKSTVKGGLLGVFLAALIAFVKTIFRQTLRSEYDLQELTDTPFIGYLPSAAKGRKRRAGRTAVIDSEGLSQDFINALRNISYQVSTQMQEKGLRTVLVTGSLRNEGKTMTAAGLAVSLAKRHYNVLLVDANLRKPGVLSILGMNKPVQSSLYSQYKNMKKLTVFAESANGNAENFWAQKRTAGLFDEWKQKYDVIIVDTAASAVVPDAAQLARYADGYIYVVRSNYAAASRIREGMDMLSGTNCSPIGCVINKY